MQSLGSWFERFQTVASTDYLTVSYFRFVGGSENGAIYEHEWADYTAQGTLNLKSGGWPNAPLPSTPPTDLEAAPNGYEWGCVRLPVSTEEYALGFMQLLVTPPAP